MVDVTTYRQGSLHPLHVTHHRCVTVRRVGLAGQVRVPFGASAPAPTDAGATFSLSDPLAPYLKTSKRKEVATDLLHTLLSHPQVELEEGGQLCSKVCGKSQFNASIIWNESTGTSKPAAASEGQGRLPQRQQAAPTHWQGGGHPTKFDALASTACREINAGKIVPSTSWQKLGQELQDNSSSSQTKF